MTGVQTCALPIWTAWVHVLKEHSKETGCCYRLPSRALCLHKRWSVRWTRKESTTCLFLESPLSSVLDSLCDSCLSSHHQSRSSSVQSLSRVQLFATQDCSTPGLPVHHQLLEFDQTHVIQSVCHPTISSSVVPFSSHLQSFPASASFQISQFFA